LLYSIDFIKKIERSVSLILGILGNLGHFRHLFIKQNQVVITKSLLKNIYDKLELISSCLSYTEFSLTSLHEDVGE
jgi:hypothetical protein